jgi:hypothetical protein
MSALKESNRSGISLRKTSWIPSCWPEGEGHPAAAAARNTPSGNSAPQNLARGPAAVPIKASRLLEQPRAQQS